MFPVLELGPLSLPSSPLILLLAFWLGSAFSERRSKRAGRDPELISRIIWLALVYGLVGARLSFIARNPSAFLGDWKSIVSLNPALLDPSGGLIIALGISFYLASKNGLGLGILLDDLVPFIAVLAPAIFLANFASGSGYGALTNLPWGVELWGGRRHPVQIYLLLSSLVVLFLVAGKPQPSSSKSGFLFLNFLVYTTGYLTFLYSFQDPAGNTLAGFRINQLLAWAVFTGSIFLSYRFRSQQRQELPGN